MTPESLNLIIGLFSAFAGGVYLIEVAVRIVGRVLGREPETARQLRELLQQQEATVVGAIHQQGMGLEAALVNLGGEMLGLNQKMDVILRQRPEELGGRGG